MRFFLLLLYCGPIFSQAITVGVIGGVPVTDTFDTGGVHFGSLTAKTVRYMVGGVVDFRLLGPLRAEIDAIYQPFSFQTSTSFGVPPTYTHTYGNLWQFPVLAKVRIPTPGLKPFVSAGPSVQLASGITQSSYNLVNRTPVVEHPGANAVAGISVGGGFEFHVRPLILAPELRYTRWFDQNFNPFNTPDRGSNLNQVEVLLSIRI